MPLSVLLLAALCSVTLPISAQSAEPDDLWADFGHYVRIAQPELASQAATALVEQTSPAELLDAVETSRFDQLGQLFRRAKGMEGLGDIAGRLENKIQEARIERSREEQRIADDIQKLGEGQRAYLNATQRLTAAGQFAAPQLLAALNNPEMESLHGPIRRAMVEIGRPMVLPLSTALPGLQPDVQGQVALVLGEIGYPQAIPALAEALADDSTDAAAKRRIENALNDLMNRNRAPSGLSPAEMYLRLGLEQYSKASVDPRRLASYDSSNRTGVVWFYDENLTVTGSPGLTGLVVPGEILGDALAMQSAQRALELDPALDQALSLYLMANLRRENRLPEGETDPTYPDSRQAPSYYAMVAGPQRLSDVLDRALSDGDVQLALDAIDGISKTAGRETLQPLVRGLNYSNRMVRFRAAQALAAARPQESFDAAYRVVPTLAASVRQDGVPYAAIFSTNEQSRNALSNAASQLGYEPVAAASVPAIKEDLESIPGIDLMLVEGEPFDVRRAIDSSALDAKLSAAPILALSGTENQTRLASEYENNLRVTVVAVDPGTDALSKAVEVAQSRFSGTAITQEVATELALTSLALLRDLAIEGGLFEASNALPALLELTNDERSEVAIAAGDVLSKLDNARAQSGLAEAAVTSVGDVQAAYLIDLAESATAFGNLISAQQSDAILQLVKTTRGDLAVAAAQAHGALTLPTRNAVELILND
jgi:HEAT repeat protein